MKKRVISAVLAAALSISMAFTQMPYEAYAAQESVQEQEIKTAVPNEALDTVRNAVKEDFQDGENKEATSFDIDLSSHTFDGAAENVLDYGQEGSPYLQVLENIRTGDSGGTMLFRFKTTSIGMMFGFGSSYEEDGTNMTVGVNGDSFRMCLRNEGAKASGLKGTFASSGLKDGSWHTAAISFKPEQDGESYIIVDGGTNIYPPSWVKTWFPGMNKRTEPYTHFQIGGGSYDGAKFSCGGNFNGAMEFLTITSQEFSEAELKELTAMPQNPFKVMTEAGSAHTWLFTGGQTTVSQFDKLGTVKNYVGFFEDNLRAGGTFVERSRFVYNTAKPGMTIARLDSEYQTLIGQYLPKAVGIMIDRGDYEKGFDGIEAFQTVLAALLDKITEDDGLPFLITPVPSLDGTDLGNISLYTAAVEETAESKGVKVVSLTDMPASYLNEDNSLTALGHQYIANAVKTGLGISGHSTNYTGFSFAAEPTMIKVDAAPLVTVGEDQIEVAVPEEYQDASWSYELSDGSQTLSEDGREGEFTITGLEEGTAYTLSMVSEGEVQKRLEDVEIEMLPESIPQAIPHEDGNVKVIDDIQGLMQSEEPVTYLFMGDSITHGIVTQGYNNVPELFEKYLHEQGRTDDMVINTGVSNATISTTLNQIDRRLNRYDPDVVFVMLGTNDCSTKGERAEGGTGFTLAEFKDGYKELVRDIYNNNKDSYVVLRVPCDMNPDPARSEYKTYFAAIDEVAAEMKTEIPELKISVVNHMQNWIEYGENVRNDFLGTGANGWLVDEVHPNIRGNMRMFQQLLKETGLYKNDSVMSNYTMKVSDWAEDSDAVADVVCHSKSASLDMGQLSGYADGLSDVKVTLTSKDGVSVSAKAAFAADGSIEMQMPKDYRPYNVSVTGTNAVNHKTIHFTAKINGKLVGDVYTKLDSSKLTGVAESQETGEGPAGSALDNNTATYWHSNWSGSADQKPVIDPETGEYLRNGYTITLDSNQRIGKFEYLPRQDNNNGQILKYKLYYSASDDGEFIEIPGGSGEWEANRLLKTAVFDPVDAKRIQIRALQTRGDNTGTDLITAAEFYLYEFEENEPVILQCGCQISGLTFDGQGIQIEKDEESKQLLLDAKAEKTGECTVEGHSEKTEVSYVYEILEDESHIASLAGNILTVTGAGTVKVKVTAAVDGTEASDSKTASIMVTKEADPGQTEYTASFIGGEGAQGTAPGDLKAEAGSTVTLPANSFTKDGYVFMGWNDGAATYAPDSAYTMPEKDVTFTAVWNEAATSGRIPNLKGTADSVEASQPVGNALDENTNTHWHTAWNGDDSVKAIIDPANDHYERNGFTIDLGQNYSVNKFEYLPRQGEATDDNGYKNGRIGRYRLLYSAAADGDDFVEIPDARGSWQDNTDLKACRFNPINARRIRIEALATYGSTGNANKFVNAAEFYVWQGTDPVTDPDCTCSVSITGIEDQEVRIPLNEDTKEITLNPTAALSEGCPVSGHPGKDVEVTCRIAEDSADIAELDGTRLTLKGAGTVKIAANAQCNGIREEKTITITVTKEEPEQECTCQISGLAFEGRTVEIPADAESQTLELSAEASLTGDCQLEGHGGTAISYGYTITEDEGQTASLEGNLLTVSKAGTITVMVTASANDKSVSKAAVITVTKEEKTEEKTKYTVTYLGGEGTQGTAPEAFKAQAGESLTLIDNPFTKDGYEFRGWSDGLSVYAPGSRYTMPEANMTFTAAWDKKIVPPVQAQHKLTLNANGGKSDKDYVTVTEGGIYPALPVPVRAGYTFKGWFISPSGGSQIKAGDTCNLKADAAVYAQWTAIALAKPGKVSGLKAASSDTKKIKLSWKRVSGATGYYVYRYNSASRKWEKIKTTTGLSYTNSGLKYGTAYKYRVKAYSQDQTMTKEGDFSKTLTTATRPKKPLLKTNRTGTKVRLSWKKGTGASGIVIYMKTGNGNYQKKKVRGASKTAWTKEGLKKGKVYTFRIRGYKKAGGKNYYSSYSAPRRVRIK